MDVSVDRESLQTGDYESTISFAGDGGTATLTVTMEVDNSIGLLNLSTSSLDFGQDNESSQVTLTNEGTSALDWSATVNDSWISLDAASGSLDVGANTTLTVTVDRTNLDAGTFEGTVDFASNGETTTLLVNVEVKGGELSISETNLSLGVSDPNRTITFENVGVRSLSWTSEENTSWLNMAPKEGTIEVGATATILIEVDRTGLGLGDYSGDITVTSEGQTFTISVSMTVAQDTDGDGVPDEIDADVDGDGLMEIYTINDLNEVRNDLDASGDGKQGAPAGGFTGYELMNDLDFDSDASYSDLSLKPDVTAGSGWEPIGANSSSNRFNTVFEGNGFTISNLFINRTTSFNGIFGYVDFLGELRNISIEIRFLSGDDFSAALAGFSVADIINCSAQGTVQSPSGGSVGLLVGRFGAGSLANCFAIGEIAGNPFNAGGLIGSIGFSSNDAWFIENSYADVIVSGSSNVGGLVGGTYWGSSESFIRNSYASGNISATSNSVGGLIGVLNYGSITNCYSSGDVVSSSFYIGGFVGNNSRSITSCYSLGTVQGSSNIGGFSGRGATNITQDNYWDTQTSGIDTSAGGTGQTTSQLQGPTSNTGIYIT
ncbi:MAG: BACON domain-containing protein, partial [Ekhidna sp.]|nr:BACON domain-containing protein [Ekhidna sp.]